LFCFVLLCLFCFVFTRNVADNVHVEDDIQLDDNGNEEGQLSEADIVCDPAGDGGDGEVLSSADDALDQPVSIVNITRKKIALDIDVRRCAMMAAFVNDHSLLGRGRCGKMSSDKDRTNCGIVMWE